MTSIGYYEAPTLDDAPIGELVALLGAGLVCAWLEDPFRPDGLLLRDDVSDAELIKLVRQWPSGRLFTLRAELRWERMEDGRLQLVVVADEPLPTLIQGVLALTPRDEQQHLLLWGRREEETWSEGRIPALHYPSSWSGPYAAVVVQQYEAPWEEQATVRMVTRYLGFVGEQRMPYDGRFLKKM